MHILIISSEHFLTSRSRLGGIFQMHQAKALKNAGNQVGVLSVGVISPRFYFEKYNYMKNENINNINILRRFSPFYIPSRWLTFENLKSLHIRLGLKIYRKYVRQHGMPDIIHAHNFLYAGFIAEGIKKKYNIPFIVTEHSSRYARGVISHNLNISISQCARNALSTTAVSSAFAKFLQKKIKGIFIEVLPNIVDSNFLTARMKEKVKNKFVYLNIASLDSNKNQQLLINSFAKISKNKTLILKIVGEGVLLEDLKGLTKKLDIENNVLFLGLLTQDKVIAEMSKADCFVLSSDYETFGVVLIEAMACGLPLIATKSGGPEDIVNSENGILVNTNAQKELEDAMLYMYDNREKYDKEKLRHYAKSFYGEKAFVDNVMHFYRATR